MSFNLENAELDRILADADYVEPNQTTVKPGPIPELLGALESPINNANSTEGMAPREGNGREMRIETALARSLLFDFQRCLPIL